MDKDKEKVIIGMIFLIGGALFLVFTPTMSKLDEFSFTLSAFFLSISALFGNEEKGISNYLKYFLYVLGLGSLFILPQYEDNEIVINVISKVNISAFLMFSLGITFLSMHFNDKDKVQIIRKLEQEKHEAVLSERKKITNELYKRIKKKED